MNTTDYVTEATRQLSDPKTYQPLDEDPTPGVCKDIQKVLDTMLTQQFIDEKCHKFLSPTEPRPGRFYLLPKIHKSYPPLKGRPIIAAIGSPCERLSEFLDYFLLDIVKSQSTYVKDTTDILNKLDSITLPPHTILVSSDL
jgi:hypothetical protein